MGDGRDLACMGPPCASADGSGYVCPNCYSHAPAAGLMTRAEIDRLLVRLREVARLHGYALAVHGTLARDIDLIAVPWTDEAQRPADLAEAIRVAAGGAWPDDNNDPHDFVHCGSRAQPKPHGRFAYAIHMRRTYIDLSIMWRERSHA